MSEGQLHLQDAAYKLQAFLDAEDPFWLRSVQRQALMDILRTLEAAKTEIISEMEALAAKIPNHCCGCGREHGKRYLYSGLCDICYEDRIA